MATTTVFEQRQNNQHVLSGIATIDSGETATLAIPCGGRALVRLGLPTLTGTSLTFTVQPFPPADPAAPTLDPPFRTLRDDAGNVVTVTVSGTGVVEVPELAGAYAFTIVSGSAEGAAREIEVQCVGPYPASGGNNKLTIEGGSVTVSGTVTSNQGTAGAAAWAVSAPPVTSAILSGSTTVTPVFAAISGASSGDNTLVAADATKKIRVFALSVVAAGAVTVRFESAAGGTALTGVMSFAANGGYVLPFNPAGWFETSANQLLNMELGGAVQVSGHLTYGLVA